MWSQAPVAENTAAYKQYREWTYNVSFELSGNLITENVALGSGNGGGVAIENGVMGTVSHTIIANNTAALYGGGLYMDSAPNAVTFAEGCLLLDNRVREGAGEQFASFSGGALGFQGLTAAMTSGKSQVLVQGGGSLTLSNITSFTCPEGYLFTDVYGGLYGADASLLTESGWMNPVLVSTLLFQCVPCGPGTYTLGAGTSSGLPATTVNPVCRPCPYGGVCTSGVSIVAAVGFWGAVVRVDSGAEAVFTQCPDGYCCTGEGGVACSSINACAGNRTGTLCGKCAPGYGEVLASSTCRAVSECTDGKYLWPLGVLGFLFIGCIMLVNSTIWCPRAIRKSGLVKLASYYYQVRAWKCVNVCASVRACAQAIIG